MILPISGEDGALIRNLVEHVVQIIEGIDDLNDLFTIPDLRATGFCIVNSVCKISFRFALVFCNIVEEQYLQNLEYYGSKVLSGL